MKRLLSLAGSTLVMASLTGCPGGATVHTDYDHNTHFSQFHTFSFGEVSTDNPLYQQRIKDEIGKDLQAKGLQMADGKGDLVVTAVGSQHDRKQYNTFYNNPGFGGYYYGGFGEGFGSTTTVMHDKVGTLVVDMYNANSKHLVWRGTASHGVSGDPGNNTAAVNGAIDKMLSNFPPS